MKMENDIICESNGVVEEVFIHKGENVETGKKYGYRDPIIRVR